jgi:hypothetical protein
MPNAHHISNATTVQTAHTDSVAKDSVAHDTVPAYYAPKYLTGFPDSTGNDMHIKQLDQLPVMTVPAESKPQSYENTPLHDTGTMLLVLLSFIFIAISYKNGYLYIRKFMHNMFSVRERQNLFDDPTASDAQILTALIANTCIMEGIALYMAVAYFNPTIDMSVNVFKFVGVLTGVALVLYMFQLLLYNTVGYVFSDKNSLQLWLDGFFATQSLLGLLLFPVVFIMLLYPETMESMLFCSALLYILARIVFICKGFRIFYNNLSSCLYFILYLCSVEIVPVILSYIGAVFLCNILQS